MKKNKPDEILVVVQAYKDCKTIEHTSIKTDIGNWYDSEGSPAWAFDELHYRVKRKARTLYINEYSLENGDSSLGHAFTLLKYARFESQDTSNCIGTLKFMEVLPNV